VVNSAEPRENERGRSSTRSRVVAVALVLGLVAVSTLVWNLRSRGNESDLRHPRVGSSGARSTQQPGDPQSMREALLDGMSQSAPWNAFSEEQRRALVNQVGDHLASYLSSDADSWVRLMESWGGRLGTPYNKLTRQRVDKLWSTNLESFPVERFNPSQARLGELVINRSAAGPVIEIPSSKDSLTGNAEPAFDFGPPLQIANSVRAVVTLPVSSRRGEASTWMMVYCWSEEKKRWLPGTLFYVTAAGRSIASGVLF